MRDFLITFYRTQNLLEFLLGLVGHADHVAKVASDALIDTARTDSEREELRQRHEARVSAIDALKKHRQILMEIVLARHVDNYLAFISALLAEVFVQRPETLKSADKVEVEWVLGHESMESLVAGLAERRVDALAYQSFGALRDHMKDRYGLAVCSDDDAIVIVEAIETRNIIVHNRCVISRRYIERTSAPLSRLGRLRTLGIQDVERLIPVLVDSALKVDRGARAHLKLRGHRFDAASLAGSP